MSSLLDNFNIDDSWKLAIKKSVFIIKCAFGAFFITFIFVIISGVCFWLLPFLGFDLFLDIFEIIAISPFEFYYDFSIFLITFAFILGFTISSIKVIIDITNLRR